ncbi:hypothetical protein T01_2811 [Trichinella spiralis]|uniref:Uncharacterized protein n=1 Tax=Trichinella spiralis TaxID=6334 RepID=A0A0V1AP18_TRISP|nr:hypothetical protein T01_2811 [Trichinella spiralis]
MNINNEKTMHFATYVDEISVSAMRIAFTFGSATIKFSSKQIVRFTDLLEFETVRGGKHSVSIGKLTEEQH